MSNCTQHVKFSLHPIGIRFQLPWSTTSIVREHNLASRSTSSVTRGHISDCLRTQSLLSGNSVCAAWIQFRSLGNTITHFSQRHVIGSPAVRFSARVVRQWPTKLPKKVHFKTHSALKTLCSAFRLFSWRPDWFWNPVLLWLNWHFCVVYKIKFVWNEFWKK